MAKVLGQGVNLLLTGPKGDLVYLNEGDEVPAWAKDKVGDHVYDDADAGEESQGDGPPPLSGKGSGKDAWRAYAEANDVAVEADASRDDIVAALEAAGVPTESAPE